MVPYSLWTHVFDARHSLIQIHSVSEEANSSGHNVESDAPKQQQAGDISLRRNDFRGISKRRQGLLLLHSSCWIELVSNEE